MKPDICKVDGCFYLSMEQAIEENDPFSSFNTKGREEEARLYESMMDLFYLEWGIPSCDEMDPPEREI